MDETYFHLLYVTYILNTCCELWAAVTSHNRSYSQTQPQPHRQQGGMSSSDLSPLLIEHALDLAYNNESLVITGSGGVGKTHLIRRIETMKRDQFRLQHPHENQWKSLQLVSHQALAALHIGGRTVYSLMGWRHDANTLERRVRCSVGKIEDLQKIRTLVWDEISMSDAFDVMCVEHIFSRIRIDCVGQGDFHRLENPQHLLLPAPMDAPFGGRQIILVGDWAQLPPVMKGDRPEHHWELFEGRGGFKREEFEGEILGEVSHFFELPFFNTAFPKDHIIHLTKCWRQEDTAFVDLLNRVRLKKHTPEDIVVLQKTSTNVFREDAYKGTEADPYPEDLIRATRLYCKNGDVTRENQLEMAKLRTPEVRFRCKWDGREDKEKEKKLHIETILKRGAQVIVTANTQWNVKNIKNGSRGVIVGFCDKPKEGQLTLTEEDGWSDTGEVPVVKFLDGSIGIAPLYTRDFEDGGAVTYYPLRLGWAATVHSCQGMTLDLVHAVVDGTFERGQFYVVISRVRSLEGLRLIGFTEACIIVDAAVVDFYDELAGSSAALLTHLVEKQAQREAEEQELLGWPPTADDFDPFLGGVLDLTGLDQGDFLEGVPDEFDVPFVYSQHRHTPHHCQQQQQQSPRIKEIVDVGIQVDLLQGPPLVCWCAGSAVGAVSTPPPAPTPLHSGDTDFQYDEEEEENPRKRQMEEIETDSSEETLEDEERPSKKFKM